MTREVEAVTVSMRVMSAGDGYRYLLRTVVIGDADHRLSTPLTRYYAGEGTPPGRWMGSGLPALAGGAIHDGDVVSERQLQLLIGMGCDPASRAPLGRAYRSRAATTAPCAAVGPGCATETGGPSHVSTRTGRWNSAATAHDGRRA